MAAEITCPNCGHSFELNESIKTEVEKELRGKMVDWQKKKEEDFENQKTAIEAAAQKKAMEGFTVKMKMLEEESRAKTLQLQDVEKKQLELLRERSALEEKQKNFELELEKRILQSKKEIEDNAVKKEQEIFDLRLKEKDILLESMQKNIDDLKRKSEQGSMQLQGESQELLLEDLLKEKFPFDLVEEVGKGVQGADCTQTVRNNIGEPAGKIIYESKRTKSWSNSWIDKLKADQRATGADVAVLVTQAFPSGITGFTEINGILVCSFLEISMVSHLVRQGILNVYTANKGKENKGDKMVMLYDYLTGAEFKGQIEAIVEGFMAMKQSITREKAQMSRTWNEREKQLEKVLLNTNGMIGSVKGIAGASVADFPLLENEG